MSELDEQIAKLNDEIEKAEQKRKELKLERLQSALGKVGWSIGDKCVFTTSGYDDLKIGYISDHSCIDKDNPDEVVLRVQYFWGSDLGGESSDGNDARDYWVKPEDIWPLSALESLSEEVYLVDRATILARSR